MRKVTTVLGDIDSSSLGFTYVHEHLYAVPPANQKDRDLELSSYDNSLYELQQFKSVGGETLVEASTIDYGRNPVALKKMAEVTGVNVIATTGFNKNMYYPQWVAERTTEEIAEYMIRDIEVGIDGTSIRAGQIKTGGSYNVLHPLEIKVTHACAMTHKKTGVPLWCHTEAGTMAHEILDIFEEHEIPMNHICVGHLDRNLDEEYLLSLAQRGIFIQFDGPGKVKYYPDSMRVAMLKSLKDHGYIKQILISGDMGRASYLKGYGGGPGFEFIKTKFIPRLLRNGFTEEDIHQIFVVNPKEWLGQER
ncbi:phosphotriesterase family protein [Anaerorhabdus sp.]|nr:phosphotriesterase-related protein [Anaerorhabdus sp.]MEA4876141.1 phosphotriesterase-related protein [Anaerorhabdus sp.]